MPASILSSSVSSDLPVGTLLVALVVVLLAIAAMLRGVDVRLALLAAALVLGFIAGHADEVLITFAKTCIDEKFIVPICSAMAFAHVLRYADCDQHLVHLLVRPLRRFRQLFVPGAVLIGFLVNVPVISQTSTAVTIGSVLVPLLASARLTQVSIGATLLLGSSVGGELLNPGAPELETIASITHEPTTDLVARLLPLALIQLAVAGLVFWLLTWLRERRTMATPAIVEEPPDHFRVDVLRALVPLLPIVLLFLVGRPLQLIRIPVHWVVPPEDVSHYDSRLVGMAMVIGAIVAAAAARGPATGALRSYGSGFLFAYVHIITLIIAANAFGKAVQLVGFSDVVGRVVADAPALLGPAAGYLPLGFAVLCGSGMASTQSLYHFFAAPSLSLGLDPARIGAIVSLGAAAGRTMSPVAAVTLMCSALTGTSALSLARRVALPLVVGMVAVVIVGVLLART